MFHRSALFCYTFLLVFLNIDLKKLISDNAFSLKDGNHNLPNVKFIPINNEDPLSYKFSDNSDQPFKDDNEQNEENKKLMAKAKLRADPICPQASTCLPSQSQQRMELARIMEGMKSLQLEALELVHDIDEFKMKNENKRKKPKTTTTPKRKPKPTSSPEQISVQAERKYENDTYNESNINKTNAVDNTCKIHNPLLPDNVIDKTVESLVPDALNESAAPSNTDKRQAGDDDKCWKQQIENFKRKFDTAVEEQSSRWAQLQRLI